VIAPKSKLMFRMQSKMSINPKNENMKSFKDLTTSTKSLYSQPPSAHMDPNLIPVLGDDIQILNVRTPERRHFVLYCASKKDKITPNEATVHLITLCDGTHTVGEIVSHFVEISGENPSSIEEHVEQILERLLTNEVITLCEVPTYVEIPEEVELIHPLQQVSIEITDACNLNCVHCYNDYGSKREDELTLEEIYHLIDELKKLGVLIIMLSGGEPLLRPDFFEIAQYVRDNSLGLELFTNGTLVTKNVAKKLKALNILDVSVSLDSPTPEIHDYFRGIKGAWKRTMKGIQNLKTNGIRIKPAVSVSQLNMKEVVPLHEFFFREGFYEYKLQPVFATGRSNPLNTTITPDEFEKAVRDVLILEKKLEKEHPLHEKEKMNCGIGTYSLVVGSNGDVRPCSVFGMEVVVGSIRDQPVKSQ